METQLTLVVIGKDADSLAAFDARAAERASVIYIANVKGEPLAVIANKELDVCCTPVFGLCHADAEFGTGSIEAFTAEAMAGNVCGIVGAASNGNYRCCYNSTAGGPVSTLDGMACFFRRDLGLRFDEQTFDGFHCHVEDLCLQAHARGISVTVPAADAHHRNHTQSPGFLASYWAYRRKLSEKWANVEFRTT